jgi:hypothetical protein
MRGAGSGFLTIILWFLMKWMIFGTQETLRDFDPSTRRLVDETTETVVALYEYSAEVATPYVDEVTSAVSVAIARKDALTSAAVSFAREQEGGLRRRLKDAEQWWDVGQTSAALALGDLAEGGTSATLHVRKALDRVRSRFR